MDPDPAYTAAFADWLACACAGVSERAARAVAASGADLLADVALAATAGHVLDFDDTFSDGVAHLSAACAPAALVVAAHLGLTLRAAVAAYAEGFEAMAAVAEASHPALYDAGWHPTTVCAPIGAAVAASELLELTVAERENAIGVAVLRAGGTRGAFGSDGKAIQVGLAAAAGVQAALLARAGAEVDSRVVDGPLGFVGVLGARWAQPANGRRAIDRNWVKLHPSCLATHSPIEAAGDARQRGYRLGPESVQVRVHPVARQAAHLDVVDDGLAAKFSIPYCVAHTFAHGPPHVRDFQAIDPPTRQQSRLVEVVVDESLPEFGAVLLASGTELTRVPSPRGAPDRPPSPSEIADKVSELAGERLVEAVADQDRPAAAVLDAAGLRYSVALDAGV